jgi:hypothetical protein
MKTPASVAQDIRAKFQEAGFAVADVPTGKIEVKKSGCVAYLEQQGESWVYPGSPYFAGHGINCELEDRGYQKFWLAKAEGKRFPVRKDELGTLHRFDEEIRYLLGLRDLYHESLGSRNARTVYDRLDGRPDR